MGHPLNTADDDIYFVMDMDGKNGYYSSGKEGGFGEKDIYHVKFPYFPFPKRFHIVELEGFVQDEATYDTLDAMVSLVDKSTGRILDSTRTTPDEPYYFVLEPNTDYLLKVGSQGYFPVSDPITSPVLEDEDIMLERNLYLGKPKDEVKPPVVTNTPNYPEVQHIYFDFDQYDLRDRSKRELELVAQILEQNPEFTLEVLGHTDYYGTGPYNQRLSENRAKTAFTYLKSIGVDRDQLVTNGLSENRPIDSNQNDEGRQYNRRVEFRFVKNDAVILASRKLRPGMEAPYVDHTRPKGEPGYDDPDAVSAFSETETEMGSAGTDRTINTDGNDTGSGSATSEIDGLTIHHIYFDFDGYGLRDRSVNELEKLLHLMENHPEYQLEIRGHTDNYGSIDYNQRLSQNRCSAAYKYLTSSGVSASRINTSGFSELKPLDTNASDGGRQNNRRVEFVLTSGGRTVLYSTP